ERAKPGHTLLRSCHFAINQIKKARADDDQPGVEEHALLVFGGGVAEKERRPGVDHQSHKREHVRGDLGERKPADDCPQQHCTGSPKCAGPGHRKIEWSDYRVIGRSEMARSPDDKMTRSVLTPPPRRESCSGSRSPTRACRQA